MASGNIERGEIEREVRKAVAAALQAYDMQKMSMMAGGSTGTDLGNREAGRNVVAGGEEGFPWGPTRGLWYVSVSGAVVTVGAGAIRPRDEAIYECAAQDVTITADGQWICWEMTYNGGTDAWTLTIASDPVTSATPPTDHDGIVRGPLYKVTLTDGVVTGVVPWQHGIATCNLWGK